MPGASNQLVPQLCGAICELWYWRHDAACVIYRIMTCCMVDSVTILAACCCYSKTSCHATSHHWLKRLCVCGKIKSHRLHACFICVSMTIALLQLGVLTDTNRACILSQLQALRARDASLHISVNFQDGAAMVNWLLADLDVIGKMPQKTVACRCTMQPICCMLIQMGSSTDDSGQVV